ncbi:MAG: hypothetical protein Q9224_002533 [Gallowayella concinna]
MEGDDTGDPTAMMNDVLNCCKLPACDQMLIIDCCFAANAFGPEHIGQRKFEMIVSSGCSSIVPAPQYPGSFTARLSHVLRKLLDQNQTGFVTSQLYREVYHSIPPPVKPWLFDQAKRDYGRIWLRPQSANVNGAGMPAPAKGGTFLNLTLKLNGQPTGAMMNQLALQLQYLPHTDQVRFEKLYAPKTQIEDFMLYIRRAALIRPLIRKVHARRRLKALMALTRNDKIPQRPLSFLSLFLEQKRSPACDWSSALDGPNPSPTMPLHSPSSNWGKKSFTWPPVEAQSSPKSTTLSNRFFSLDYRFALPRTSSVPAIFQPRPVKSMGSTSTTSVDAPSMFTPAEHRDERLALTRVRNISEDNLGYPSRGDALWHFFMWLALCYTLACFCYYMKE